MGDVRLMGLVAREVRLDIVVVSMDSVVGSSSGVGGGCRVIVGRLRGAVLAKSLGRLAYVDMPWGANGSEYRN
jgi:hypothetical protein